MKPYKILTAYTYSPTTTTDSTIILTSEQETILNKFELGLLKNQKDMPYGFRKAIDDNFCDLL